MRQVIRNRNSSPGDRRSYPDIRGHGPHERPAARKVLARLTRRAHLGWYIRDTASHHQPRNATPIGWL
ncbi:uncharacterized protein METZ01_LOCUS213039, partial [marine metagenome]